MRAPSGVEAARVRRLGQPGTASDVVAADHRIAVPLDPREPGGPAIEVLGREVRRADLVDVEQPYLVFLQGGPGCRAPWPGADGPGWLPWALARYRVVLLDQRGTGGSTPLDARRIAALGTPREQAEHLALMRADAIVADCEALRRHLLGDEPWTALGQSFGGFCTWTYLSSAPEGLRAALVTGGIPPMGADPAEVYRATTRALARRVADLDAADPRAREVLGDVARHVARHDERLPTGERLTVGRLRELGPLLGGAAGVERLTQLADDAWAAPGVLSENLLAGIGSVIGYTTRPLYALVHEASYGEAGTATRWAADRVARERLGDLDDPGDGPLELTGEMVLRHTVARDPALAPAREAAELLAERVWDRPLYDPERLRRNEVPVAARVYAQDVYVVPALSEATAAATGAVTVVTDGVHHHDGIRRAGPEVLEELAAALPDAAVPPPLPLPEGAPEEDRS